MAFKSVVSTTDFAIRPNHGRRASSHLQTTSSATKIVTCRGLGVVSNGELGFELHLHDGTAVTLAHSSRSTNSQIIFSIKP